MMDHLFDAVLYALCSKKRRETARETATLAIKKHIIEISCGTGEIHLGGLPLKSMFKNTFPGKVR